MPHKSFIQFTFTLFLISSVQGANVYPVNGAQVIQSGTVPSGPIQPAQSVPMQSGPIQSRSIQTAPPTQTQLLQNAQPQSNQVAPPQQPATGQVQVHEEHKKSHHHHRHHHRHGLHLHGLHLKDFEKGIKSVAHIADEAAKSGLLGPEAQVIAGAVHTAVVAGKDIAAGKSVEQIAKDSVRTAGSEAMNSVTGGGKAELLGAAAGALGGSGLGGVGGVLNQAPLSQTPLSQTPTTQLINPIAQAPPPPTQLNISPMAPTLLQNQIISPPSQQTQTTPNPIVNVNVPNPQTQAQQLTVI